MAHGLNEISVWRWWESETPKFGIKRVDDRGSNFHSQEIKKLIFSATKPFVWANTQIYFSQVSIQGAKLKRN